MYFSYHHIKYSFWQPCPFYFCNTLIPFIHIQNIKYFTGIGGAFGLVFDRRHMRRSRQIYKLVWSRPNFTARVHVLLRLLCRIWSDTTHRTCIGSQLYYHFRFTSQFGFTAIWHILSVLQVFALVDPAWATTFESRNVRTRSTATWTWHIEIQLAVSGAGAHRFVLQASVHNEKG